jgi:hypothetical protein
MTLILEAFCTAETSVYSNKTTRRYIPEGQSSSYSLMWEPEISHK